MTKYYEESLCICSPATAKELILKNGEGIKDALVVSESIADEDAIVVSKQEFLDWVYEKAKTDIMEDDRK